MEGNHSQSAYVSGDLSFMGLFTGVERERQTGELYSQLSHMRASVHWCLEYK